MTTPAVAWFKVMSLFNITPAALVLFIVRAFIPFSRSLPAIGVHKLKSEPLQECVTLALPFISPITVTESISGI
jgi:hypothetical protein